MGTWILVLVFHSVIYKASRLPVLERDAFCRSLFRPCGFCLGFGFFLSLFLPSFLVVQRKQWSGWTVFLSVLREPSASAGTVLLIDLFPTGFHGDGNAHPTAARRHTGHLTPGVSVWVIAFHAV